MDYIGFINSRDVREHLNSIGYTPSLFESAFFVYSSKKKTLDEKHEAWNALIRESDDMMLDENAGDRWSWIFKHNPETAYEKSVHSLIKNHMCGEKTVLEYFFSDNTGSVYVPSFIYCRMCAGDTRLSYEKYESGLYFGCYDEARNYCLKEIDDDNEKSGYAISKYLMSKPGDERSNYVTVEFNRSGEVMSVDISAEKHERFPGVVKEYLESEEEFSTECDFFGMMWFDIPIPFKKGDIVIDVANNRGSNPFVLLDTDPAWRKEMVSKGKKYHEGHDSSDMNAFGWSIGFGDDPSEIYDDEMSYYLDIEYYRGEYKGIERLLPLLAEQIKGNIDIWEWEKLKGEIIRTSRDNPYLSYWESDPLKSGILKGNATYNG